MSQTQIFDVSGGVQTATTWQMRQANEVYDAENMRFDKEIGGAERRLGYELVKNFSTTYPLGSFVAEFSTGDYIFYAYNDAIVNPTATILSYYDHSDDSSHVVKNDYPANCKLSFVMNADELYVAGITTDTGARQSIINITNKFVVSSSRNLFTAPKASFIGENSGALYAMNVEVDGVVHADRAYISSPQRGAITYVNAAVSNITFPTTATTNVIRVDSARYIKVGMALDIYQAGTNTRLYTITPISVDKSKDTFTYTPSSTSVVSSTHASDLITVASTEYFPTGTVCTITGADVPAGLTSNATYYAINLSPTTMAFATTYALAIAGTKVPTSDDGSGTMTVSAGAILSKTDEIWLAGRHSASNPSGVATTAFSHTNDTFTIPNAASLFKTGDPIYFTCTGVMYGGLTANTTYYMINTGADTFMVADSYAHAIARTQLDLANAGSGTQTLFSLYAGGAPSLLWNTDYRSPQTSDFIFIASGKTSSTAINGWAKSNNRLNIFTKSSMWQYDNANFLPIFLDVGCANHDTICNNGTFLIWLDAEGKVRARDSNSGQDQIISRAMKNQFLDILTSSNLSNASAVMYDSNYKLNVGQMTLNDESKYTLFVYNFDMNIWWREKHKRDHTRSFIASISGKPRLYFLDQLGNMFLDESTNLDYTDSIPWYIQYGRRNFGVSSTKIINGFYVYNKNLAHATAAVLMVKLPGIDSSWKTVGQVTSPITAIGIPDTMQLEAQDFDFKISGNSKGQPAKIEGIEVWTHVQQSTFA